MKEAIEQIFKELGELKATTAKEAEEARIRFLGKKGEITALMEQFRSVAPELKREYGQKLNELKKAANARIEELKFSVEENAQADAPKEDLSMPGDAFPLGSRHPVSIVRTCTEEVWVRRRSGFRWPLDTKKVSCISRAGWFGGKLSASNTCQSSSISGPSATS